MIMERKDVYRGFSKESLYDEIKLANKSIADIDREIDMLKQYQRYYYQKLYDIGVELAYR